jgi:hypothetical protein
MNEVKILSAKAANPKANTSSLESRIDKMVYHLYGLAEEEVTAVEEKVQTGIVVVGGINATSK